MERTYSIQFVSKITGINAHTIRAWEKRYQAVVPKRAPKGKRQYSDKDVERLKKLNELVKLGNAISDVAGLNDEDLNKMYAEFILGKTQSKNVQLQTYEGFSANILSLLSSYDISGISKEFDAMIKNSNLEEAVCNFIYPLLDLVGESVIKDGMDISHEHILSALIKAKLGELLFKDELIPISNQRPIIITTPSNEEHEISILIIAVLCKFFNKAFLYLGPNSKAECTAKLANRVNARAVILGVHDIENFQAYLATLRSNLENDSTVFLGGSKELKNFEEVSRNMYFLPSFESFIEYLKK